MFREFKRLCSYSHDTWPHEPGKPCASRLARTGFYYNHLDHMITCYFCLLTLPVVSVCEDIEMEHTRLSPQCSMQHGTASDNVSLISPDYVLMKTDDLYQPEVETSNDVDQADAPPSIKKSPHRTLLGIYNQFIKAFDRAKKSGAVKSSASIHGSTANLTVKCVSSISGSAAVVQVGGSAPSVATSSTAGNSQNASQLVTQIKPDFERLKNEEARLQTYREWPSTAHAEPRLLAATGLFYTGPGDRVQCAFCNVCLTKWEIGDVPHVEHRKHSPRCPFLRGRDVTNTGDASRSADQLPLYLQTQSFTNSDSKLTNPKHPEFTNLEVRVQSFSGKQLPRGQNSQALASAGFYYVGPLDNVKCFHCDGGLKNWKPTDDPWIEHETHFPRCGYLKMVRNQKTIHPAQQANPPSLNVLRSVAGISTAPDYVTDTVSPSQHFSFEPREIKARMDSPAVKAVLRIGYSPDIIKRAIEKQLSETGDDFPNTESLVEAIINLQEQVDPSARLLVMPESRVSVGASSLSTTVPVPMSVPVVSLPASLNRASETSSSPVQPRVLAKRQEEMVTVVTDTAAPTKSSKKSKKTRRKKQKTNQGDRDTGAATNVSATIDDDEDETEVKDAAAASTLLEDPDSHSLIEENRQLKDAKLCKICLDEESNTVFLPCGHLTSCDTCAPVLKNCPICRAFIRGTVRIFVS